MTKELKQAAQAALEALEEIALAGMSGTGQESEEGLRDWHARQAWKFIGIAARELEPLRRALALRPAAQTEREAFEAWFDDYYDKACAEFGGIDCTDPKGIAEDAWQARASLPTQPAAQATPEPVKTMFAASVAARKWAELQDQGHRMQSLQFDGGPGGAGSIDQWGKVMWATPEPLGEPFGYFRALPFGWEQCGEHDDGAVALYDHPAPGVPEDESGRWFTVVYKDVQPGDEARDIASHPKARIMSWSNAVHDRDDALAAAQAKGDAHD